MQARRLPGAVLYPRPVKEEKLILEIVAVVAIGKFHDRLKMQNFSISYMLLHALYFLHVASCFRYHIYSFNLYIPLLIHIICSPSSSPFLSQSR